MVKIASIICVALLFMFLGTGCDHIVDSQPAPAYNLSEIHIQIDDESGTKLINNSFANFYVPVRAQIAGIGYEVGIRCQGHVSRSDARRSYKLKFSDDQLFQGRQKKLILSSQLRDPSYMRYKIALSMYRNAGLYTLDADLAVLIMNQAFAGIYLMVEPVDEYFLKRRGIAPGNLYKAIEGNARFSFENGYQVRSGFEKKIHEDDNYRDLEELIYLLDTTPDSLVKQTLSQIIDVENIINYLAVSVLINNWDGFVHNFYFFHHPESDRFIFIPYDLDMTLGIGCPHTNLHVSGHSSKGVVRLFEKILSVPAWKSLYKKQLNWLLDSVFTVGNISAQMELMYNEVADDYRKDYYLERRGYNLKNEMDQVLGFVQERAQFVREELKNF